MPPEWYRSDPAVYQWERGDPESWFLFARDSHVRVFAPRGNGVRARVAMRVSRLQVGGTMTVTLKGGASQNVTLPGPAASAQQYDAIDHLDGPGPTAVAFNLDLHPGWNDVDFAFSPENGERSDLGPGVISAAVAPDLSFTRIGAASVGASAGASDPSFTSIALTNPRAGLIGDPEVMGSVTGTANRGISVAIALSDSKGHITYRLFPVARDGVFDINFMHAFPNDWNDVSSRVVGIWLLARGNHPRFKNLYYAVHAMPARALRQPQSLTRLPIRIDGRSIGAGTVFLTAGNHKVASADKQVKIGLLTLDPVTLPRTRDFGLVWQRRSPTAIDVTSKSTATPFLLVFGEAYHPEWQATYDGEVLPHVIVNGVDNGWIVPSLPDGGTISLTFTGQLPYVVSGAISVIALIIMIVLAWSPDLWPVRTKNS
jgi:hypothetical protein